VRSSGRCYIVRLLPYRTNEDRIEGAVMTFFDITARREAEEQARASEARMRMVAESASDYAIITIDEEGHVTSWNKGAEYLFGYTSPGNAGPDARPPVRAGRPATGVPADELRRAREMAAPRTSAGTCARMARASIALIYINAEMLARLPEVQRVPPAMRALTLIRDSVSSQAKIISDLLDISRLSTGKLSLACQEVDLCEVTAKWVDGLRIDPIVSGLDLQCTLPDAPLLARVDAIRMEQVVLNLLNNALKFTPAGGSVQVTLAQEAAFARLDVIDTGAGIAAQYLPHIFEMYEQGGGAAQRSASGLGIGLALVRHIVELHGGRVEAASAGVGLGSRFSLWIPLLQPGQTGCETSAAAPENPLAGKHILLVDDMEDALYLFKELLELDGATVEVATSARQGLDLLSRQPFDLLLSDISMPDMDGYAFLRAVRAQPALRGMPAIAASGLGQEKDVRMAIEAGFSDHITKPVSVEVIRDKAGRLMNARG
jgi:two-component system CheB/CheR fusion protein